jgi:WD40 repeat protein
MDAVVLTKSSFGYSVMDPLRPFLPLCKNKTNSKIKPSFSDTGNVCLSRTPGELEVWTPNRQKIRVLPCCHSVFHVCFSPNGDRIATVIMITGGYIGLEIVNTEDSTRRTRIKYPSSSQIQCLCYSPDSQRIVLGLASGAVKIVNTDTYEMTTALTALYGVRAVKYFGDSVFFGTLNGVVTEFTPTVGVRLVANFGEDVTCLDVNDSSIVVGFQTCVVRVLNRDGECRFCLNLATDVVFVGFTCYGSRVVSCSLLGRVQVNDTVTGEQYGVQELHQNIRGFALRPETMVLM